MVHVLDVVPGIDLPASTMRIGGCGCTALNGDEHVTPRWQTATDPLSINTRHVCVCVCVCVRAPQRVWQCVLH